MKVWESHAPVADRFAGCLLGLAVGDAVGAPYEGLTHADIFFQFGTPDKLATNPSGDTLYYTDDTEMMIGVAETLAECGRIDETRLCRAFAENYHPERGYGQGARRVIEAMARGEDYRTLAANIFPGGSFGNGAAMRVAPIGLVFADTVDELREQARLSALSTHAHPLGIEGAQVLAHATALALHTTTFNRKQFYRELLARATTEEFRWHLSIAAKLKPGDSLSGLGSTLHAHRSVVTAIACFAATSGDFEMTIARAIGLGDDTDTVAAMAGSLVGAFAGVGAIPAALLEKLEDGPAKGRAHISRLAAELTTRYEQRRATTVP
ncbi:ADP-ribosyl-[dinitrogen reductase] glycohydrolase [Gemmata sp. SH-PL17]|uniref:ADP-ribosylglycohydrolase family protein n=1 Tax=Gemmata sp. SH-PL17 TaxID=1630693 RepID=UPI00078EDF69|nr:ADP-ribosylglycohydrolase family protein [Gemmata sp. SH-PL17]AMV24929.1 ADP-ribosyl-[dinitrogen reductase] glycohydrolase [Gemmata sp. SH-PL17]